MIKIYSSDDIKEELEVINNLDDIKKGCWINITDPTEGELLMIEEATSADPVLLRYALDMDEKSRIDDDDNQILILINAPTSIEESDGEKTYITKPIGMLVVADDYLITITKSKDTILSEFETGLVKSFSTYKKTRFIFQIMYKISSLYIKYLDHINNETNRIGTELQKSMENKSLIKLLNMQKGLVYFSTSIKSNEIVMEKLVRGNTLPLYEADRDLLDDTIIENKQAMEMSKTYSEVLNGMMDTYASIISNNLNIVMKFLAGITIVLAIPTIIASFFGMNVTLPFTMTDTYAFAIIVIFTVVLSAIVYFALKRNKMM